ncbi:circadian clock protein KaiC [Ignicoccus islandicus DSM 13165]|uniref:Circadian clock protein KaiC n=1 Tax=Ignicoccus islandicus DSM 13165 TaxID=940295 RepID=A0A0U3E0X7_9CREN|nr:KaiC domain-containing protein [Ignicoccus islandicus]ALU11563.1 circadian clock protein KaiC [Ignicoccus islandicus DSM 13165]
MKRLSTGIGGLDRLIAGGIPEGFLVAAVGEPGTGKTIFSLHFAWRGIIEGQKVIYVTTEESRESIVNQAKMFGMDFEGAMRDKQMIIIDALLRSKSDKWNLVELSIEELVSKIIEAKKELGFGEARVVIDSMSAFWLDKPAMARKYSYFVKRVLNKWNMTIVATSQYAITTNFGFGFGIEHVADGIIRFKKLIKGGELKRYLIIEKMRQTPHSLKVHEIEIRDGIGMVVKGPVEYTRDEVTLPKEVREAVIKGVERRELEEKLMEL